MLTDRLAHAIGGIWRRSFENPQTSLSDPAEWLYEMFGGGKAAVGVDVNRRTVLGLPPMLRAVALISTSVAKLPLITYKRLPEGGKARAHEHAAYFLLRRKVTPEMTAFQFKQTIQSHALLKGNGYAYVRRQQDAIPFELWLLGPDITYPVRKDGVLWYITRINNEERKLPARDVIHHRGLGFDGLVGYPLLEIARDALGLGLGVQKYRSTFFANNAQPSFVLEHPGAISDKAAKNIIDSWNVMHAGLDKSHRPHVLEEGMKLNAFSINAKDAQLAETLPFTARDVSCLTGVPSHKLGDPNPTSYASLEQEEQSWLNDGLDGWLTSLEEECWDKLLSEQEKRNDTHVIEFLRAALVRADLGARYAAYHTAILDGWMNRDEIRERENLNPLPNGEGQKFYEPMNMGQTGNANGKAGDGENGDDDNSADDDDSREITPALRGLLADALVRMVRRIAITAERKAKQGGKEFFSWVENGVGSAHDSVVLDAIAAPMQAIGDAVSDRQCTVRQAHAVFMDTIREGLLSAAECREDELVESVSRAMAALEKDCSGIVLDQILGHEKIRRLDHAVSG